MVGAVGIESNTDRNLKDLGEMLRSAKALKNNGAATFGVMAPFGVEVH